MNQFQPQSAELVNLTGHMLTLYDGGRVLRRIPGAGRGLRVEHTELSTDRIDDADRIDLVAVAINQPLLLPKTRRGVWLVVNQVTAMALVLAGIRRPDIVFPGPAVTELGRVVGCRGLRQLIASLPDPATRPSPEA